MDSAIEVFNQSWKKGIVYLVEEGLVYDTAEEIAAFLYQHNQNLSKRQLGELLSGEREGDTELLKHFTRHVNFRTLSLVAALRVYMALFLIPGEAQKISRILRATIQSYLTLSDHTEVFAEEYTRQNANSEIPNADIAFILAFSLMMLNTDAHNPSIAEKDKMSLEAFCRNNRGIWVDDTDPPQELLARLYHEIVTDELKVRAEGIPEKQGWIRGLNTALFHESRVWLTLVDQQLLWSKAPPGKVLSNDLILGKVTPDSLNYYIDEGSAQLALVFDNEVLVEKGKKRKPLYVSDMIILLDNSSHLPSWVDAILHEFPHAHSLNHQAYLAKVGELRSHGKVLQPESTGFPISIPVINLRKSSQGDKSARNSYQSPDSSSPKRNSGIVHPSSNDLPSAPSSFNNGSSQSTTGPSSTTGGLSTRNILLALSKAQRNEEMSLLSASVAPSPLKDLAPDADVPYSPIAEASAPPLSGYSVSYDSSSIMASQDEKQLTPSSSAIPHPDSTTRPYISNSGDDSATLSSSGRGQLRTSSDVRERAETPDDLTHRSSGGSSKGGVFSSIAKGFGFRSKERK